MVGLRNDFDCDLMSLCYSYWHLIDSIEKTGTTGLYGLDDRRARIHEKILKLTGLQRETLEDITNNVDRYQSPQDLYIAISDIHAKKAKERTHGKR